MPDYPDPIPDIFLTGTINLLSGSSGVGKTAFIAALAKAFRDGTPVFGHPLPHPLTVGYIASDRPWKSSKRWFDAVGFGDIQQYSFTDDRTVTSARMRDKKQRVQLLIQSIEKLTIPDGGVVIVDTLAGFLGGNLNDYDTVGICCREIHQYLIDRQLLLIGIMHASKQKGDKGERYLNVFNQMAGTVALLGHTNTQMHLLAPDEAESGLYEFHWNPHHHPPQMFTLRRDKRGLFIPAGEGKDQPVAPKPIPPHCVALFLMFPDPPAYLTTAQIQELFPDTARSTIFNWLSLLVTFGHLVKLQHGAYQKAPEPEIEGESQ